jgi:LCP family protein required for cell wall assembly
MAKNSKKNSKKSAVIFGVEIALLLILVGCIFVYAKINEGLDGIGSGTAKASASSQDPNMDADSAAENAGVSSNTVLHGYTNIMLVGIDTRDNSEIDYANSDTMIIASINNDTKSVKLVSVYRDTLLNIDPTASGDSYDSSYISADETTSGTTTSGGLYRKANAAYANGSAKQLLSMMNVNLDLDLHDYVVVDFKSLATLIDDLGGLDIDLLYEEVVHLNNYMKETTQVTGADYEKLDLPEEGTVTTYHLNGSQAVSYARIRYTTGNDMKRTQRQRVVISKIVEKAKKKGLTAIDAIISDVLPLCRTSFSRAEIISMASSMLDYSIEDTTGFPFEHIEKDVYPNGEKQDAVIPVTLETNVSELHAWLFGEEDYQVTDAVKAISEDIKSLSGLDESDIETAKEASAVPDIGGATDGMS